MCVLLYACISYHTFHYYFLHFSQSHLPMFLFVSFWKMLFFFLELGSHHLWSSFFSISHISLKIDDSSMNDDRRQPLMSDRVLKRIAKTLSLVLVRMINTNKNKNKTSNNCSRYTKQLLSGVVWGNILFGKCLFLGCNNKANNRRWYTHTTLWLDIDERRKKKNDFVWNQLTIDTIRFHPRHRDIWVAVCDDNVSRVWVSNRNLSSLSS